MMRYRKAILAALSALAAAGLLTLAGCSTGGGNHAATPHFQASSKGGAWSVPPANPVVVLGGQPSIDEHKAAAQAKVVAPVEWLQPPKVGESCKAGRQTDGRVKNCWQLSDIDGRVAHWAMDLSTTDGADFERDGLSGHQTWKLDGTAKVTVPVTSGDRITLHPPKLPWTTHTLTVDAVRLDLTAGQVIPPPPKVGQVTK